MKILDLNVSSLSSLSSQFTQYREDEDKYRGFNYDEPWRRCGYLGNEIILLGVLSPSEQALKRGPPVARTACMLYCEYVVGHICMEDVSESRSCIPGIM